MSYQPTQCQAHREPRGHLLNVHPAPLLSSSHPLYLYSSASTATTKHHHPETHCLRALGAGSPGSGCQQGWFLVSSLSLACKCLPSCSVLTWPFLCANTPLVFLPLLIRSPVLLDEPTLLTSLNVNYFSTDPVSKYSYMWVDLQHMNFKEGHNSVHNSTDIFLQRICL